MPYTAKWEKKQGMLPYQCNLKQIQFRRETKEMALKKLNQFLRFDYEGFSKDKVLQVTGISEWTDFNTKAHMGIKLETTIVKDNTLYKQKDGENVTNRYEKLTIKLRKDVNIPMNAFVVPVNAAATVYGDYRNQLSITADDVRVLTPNK